MREMISLVHTGTLLNALSIGRGSEKRSFGSWERNHQMLKLYYGQSFVGGSLVPLDEATAALGLGLSDPCHDINIPAVDIKGVWLIRPGY